MKKAVIKLSDLIVTSNRTTGGEGDINLLAENIKQVGLINDISVKPSDKEGKFEVIAGRRRYRAVRLLKWETVPCNILEGEEIERAEEIAAAENINRLAMHPLDEAVIFKKLLENGSTLEALAKQYDRKVSEIWQRIQLLELSDDIKSMFRGGFLSLQSAALLNILDNEGQELFVKKFESSFSEHKRFEESAIDGPLQDYSVESFIAGLNNDILYKFIRDKQCINCKTRTYFEDKTLFPELSYIENDTCLNHECYLQKWNKLLSAGIKAVKKENATHETAATLIFTDGDFKKILGKSIKIDGADYSVIIDTFDIRTDKPTKGAQPCIYVVFRQTKLVFTASYLKAKDKPKAGSASTAPDKGCKVTKVVNLLNLPKDEETAAVKALKEQKNFNFYAFEQSIQKKVYWQLMEEVKNNSPDIKDIELYLKDADFCFMYIKEKEIFEFLTGNKYNEKNVAELAKLPKENIFKLLYALKSDYQDLPNPSYFDNDYKDNSFMEWVGISKDRLLKLYQEELKLLLPKQKAPVEKATEKKAKNKKKEEI